MIDLNASKMTPVLQSIYKMPSAAAPLDTLHTVLGCPANQRVDVTALIREMSSTRDAYTAHGERFIFNSTIRDGSGPERANESSFTVFQPKRETSRTAHADLHELYMPSKPVTCFALQCDMDSAKKIIKPDFERFRWAPSMSGARG